ncbi:BMA-GEI-4, isoform b [Aphelenchoides besseyi]|nr:BMA-GEI-4, isoform b [Aphelenchoides besseyi]
MNDNITYFQQVDPRSPSYSQGNSIQYETQTIEFHPTSVAQFHTSSANQFHGTNASFITTGPVTTAELATIGEDRIIIQPHQRMIALNSATGQPGQIQVVQMPTSAVSSSQPQHILITTQSVGPGDPDDGRRVAFAEYFVDQPTIIATPYTTQPISNNVKFQKSGKQSGSSNQTERTEREMIKRAKQAEAARQRYHRLNDEEKKALNLKRTLAQKRKRAREREMAELEQILRDSNDIVDDPEITEQLREKRMRARWAEAARARYSRMSEEQRREHNTKRRLRQMTMKNDKGEVIRDEEAIRSKIKEKNAKKAEAARMRYHRMTAEEKKSYNQRRTEAFRKRRMEEEELLAMPIGRINGEALDRAQQIVVRNAKRAEAARLRYQRMTPEQRKVYNQKRYTPKRKRTSQSGEGASGMNMKPKEEYDALSSLERDVLKRTQQAQQVLMRQRMNQPQHYVPTTHTIIHASPNSFPVSNAPTGTHIIQQHMPQSPHQQVTFY